MQAFQKIHNLLIFQNRHLRKIKITITQNLSNLSNFKIAIFVLFSLPIQQRNRFF
jgi:hypothetical protein